MDPLAFAAFEQRAAEAEARLNVLEARLVSSAAAGPVDAPAAAGCSEVEMRALRDMLVEAREATATLQHERDQAVAAQEKLKYQIMHLKRALVEADEKAAAKA